MEKIFIATFPEKMMRGSNKRRNSARTLKASEVSFPYIHYINSIDACILATPVHKLFSIKNYFINLREIYCTNNFLPSSKKSAVRLKFKRAKSKPSNHNEFKLNHNITASFAHINASNLII